MFFKPKRPVDPEEWEWLLAGFKWLEREFPELHEKRRLALPTATFFPRATASGPARGEELMSQVQSIAGLPNWPVRLEAFESPKGDPLSSVAAVQHGKGAAGTFQLMRSPEGQQYAHIRYGLDQINNPSGLVATFAHELSHYLLSTRSAPCPGGDPVEELFTDLTAVWLGFGIFLGNNARYSERTSGWFMNGWQGYLGERMLMTALALSETLAIRDAAAAAPYLKNYLEADLKMALRRRRGTSQQISPRSISRTTAPSLYQV